ncbi:uncharacterized protein EAE97_005544 [Botrytis byssoidea]|uniref:Uncharacterized protein n=1 Tax=Botrytis byssoidea TaxID=139641 RepID=A0A9P5M002_9HELO|nr:uncharacterized protein EAE97_005544 [Botrytis byssoidea]KAF7944911.1 hypothetical protein EAE97_005544 [Botrytis byssoidea]
MSTNGDENNQLEAASLLGSNFIDDQEVKIKEEPLEEETGVDPSIPLYESALRLDLESQASRYRSNSPALSIRLRRPERPASEMHAFTAAGVDALTDNRLLQGRLNRLLYTPHSEDEFPDDELSHTSESQLNGRVHNPGYSQPDAPYSETHYQQLESYPPQMSGYPQNPFSPEYPHQLDGSLDPQFPQTPFVDDLDDIIEVDSTMFNSTVPSEDFSASPTPTLQQEVLFENRAPSTPRASRQTIRESAKSRANRNSVGGQRNRARRAEDFAPPPGAMTAADVMTVHENNVRRRNKRYKRAGIKQRPLDDIEQDVVNTLNELGVPIDANDMYLQEVYSHRDTTLDGSLNESADSTIDTMDTDETVVPPPSGLPEEPDFPTSARWRERGPDGQARARWASARWRAKKKVQATEAWRNATKEERRAMETKVKDALVFIADPIPVGPVPLKSLAPWLRSERAILLQEVTDNNKRIQLLSKRLDTVADAYNRRIQYKTQKAGELCVAPGNGESRKNSRLTKDRTPPHRTAETILSNLKKWSELGDICLCRQHQRYLVGDFERSGDFPHGHGVKECIPKDRKDDDCDCHDHLRDFNGEFPPGHTKTRCSHLLIGSNK